MKQISILFLVILSIFSSCKTKEEQKLPVETTTSTYYFIRHAEKDRTDSTNADPHLTEAGIIRANNWSRILGEVTFDAVYSTNYNRTRQTAQPTATKNGLDITIYDPRAIHAPSFLEATKGKTVLVVGHSNTTPAFVNSVIGERKYADIDDANNSNIYIVTISNNQIIDQLLVIN
ncbi:histidine phosphatase superfamily protein (branch 1) [Flavobacteriaceae bacterium MAR_2010_72]|nr:histidine phosphatase superfamily protein (branch 1) [Flavobacteriaceae bacterium MAR_2010_72]TVZ59452.1 histidine phosphatase superfamily protein (branch 1) [Flavobacteriaceae bacterium MAR_2010_105]